MKLQSISVLLASVFCITSLLLPLPPVEADLKSDKQALLAFAFSVKHTRKLNWNAATPVCGWWVGITCNGTQVVAVRLPGIGLSGSIPPKTLGKLDGLRVLSLRSNNLYGNFPSDIASIASLQLLYLQGNNFSGALPTFLSPQLSVLDFSYNSFTGNIPDAVQNLNRLTVLNLQYNFLSGEVPDFSLPRLRLVNLSYNNLNGSIPLPLQKFPVSSFSGGNSLLCGLPLKQCPSTSSNPANSSLQNPPLVTAPRNSVSRKKFGPGLIAAVSIAGFGFLVLLAIIISLFCKKTKRDTQETTPKTSTIVGKGQITSQDFGSGVQASEKNKLFFFEGYAHSFDLEDLLKASAEVLGKGSYGTTYKASLEDGTSVVVKRLKEVAAGKKEFEVQMEVVGRIGRHPNVVPLRAYYYSKDEKLLVCNYMPSGSLFSALHGGRDAGRAPLDWDTRMKIALGSARAIAAIHKEGGPKFIHGNIKSSNVLLNEDLDPCISDIALAPLMTNPPTKSRALGYRAPEVIETRKASHKSDVYSFGVLILEMLTGKAPLQPTGHDDVIDLPRWVRSMVREEWTAEVFDVELLRYQNVEEEMVQMLQVGLACVTKGPETRPGIEEVVRMLEEIRQPESRNRMSNSEAESNGQTP